MKLGCEVLINGFVYSVILRCRRLLPSSDILLDDDDADDNDDDDDSINVGAGALLTGGVVAVAGPPPKDNCTARSKSQFDSSSSLRHSFTSVLPEQNETIKNRDRLLLIVGNSDKF